jgi:ABC-2 type transport system permease protein
MQYYAAAMAVMFMVMTALSRGANILREHETGTLPRILVSPTSKSTVLAGHIAGSLLIVLAQFIILMLGTHFIYGVDWGGWLPAILLGGTFSFAATGIGLALASLFKEPKAADSSIGLIGNIFAALSGSMLPIYAFSDSMKTVAKAVPNYWALQGFIDQMGGMGISHVMSPIAVLMVLGIVSGFVGTLRLGKR